MPATSPPAGADPARRARRSPATPDWLAALGLVVLIAVAYLPLLRAGYIWDDDINITANPNIAAGASGLWRLWSGDAPDYYPLTWTLFWIEWRLWPSAPAFHVCNVALHMLSTLLVWRLLLRLRVPAAWLGAALFAVQPVNVATVGWITEAKNTLSLAFGAASMLAFLRWEAGAGGYALSLALYVCALLSKSSVVPLGVVLAAVVWWQRGRLDRRSLKALLPFFGLAAIATAGSLWFHAHHVMGNEVARSDGFFSRLAGAGAACWFYLRTELFPVDLPIIYPRWEIAVGNIFWWLPLAGLVALFTALFSKRAEWGRGPLALFICYVALLTPILGFFQIYYMKYSLVADHWQYLASIALMAGLGALLSRLPAAVSGVVVAIFVVLAFRQATLYQSSENLWRAAAERNPNAWLAWLNLGQAVDLAGRHDEAMKDYQACLRLRPDQPIAHNNVGGLLRQQGRPDEAIPHLLAAIDSRPDFAEAHNNLGLALQSLGRADEAVLHFQKAAASAPDHVPYRANLVGALIMAHQYEAASREAEAALILRPGEPSLLFNLGLALEQQQQFAPSLQRYREALAAEPRLMLARARIAWILATAPDAGIRNGDEALRLATEVVDSSGGRDGFALDVLAAALAEKGQFKAAIDAATRAAQLSPAAEQAAIQRRVALYNAMLPFRAEKSGRDH